MDAPMKICVMCEKTITDRSYRSLSSNTSQEQYREVFKLICIPGMSGYACYMCSNKLNRIVKLNKDLETKLIKIRHERDRLISTLKDLSGVRSVIIQYAIAQSIQRGIKREFNAIDTGNIQTPETPSATPESSVSSAVIQTPTPESSVSSAIIHTPTPESSVSSAVIQTPTPESSVSRAIIHTPTPESSVSSAVIQTPTPESSVSRAIIHTPTPESSVSRAIIHTPTPESSVSSAIIHTPTPESSVPSAIIHTPAPESSVPSAIIHTPTPESSVPSAIIQNSKAESTMSSAIIKCTPPSQFTAKIQPFIPQVSAIIYSPPPKFSVINLEPSKFSANIHTPTVDSAAKRENCDWSDSLNIQRFAPQKCQGIDKFTQTKDHCEEFDVKIIVKYNGVERLKIIKEENVQAALKSLLNNSTPRAVLRNLCQHEIYRWEMLEIVRNALQEEIKLISKEDSNLFKGHISSSESLCEFDWEHTRHQLHLKAPYLYSMFCSAISLHEKKNLKQMLTSIAVLLYGRSKNTNQLQYLLGLTLKKYGLSKEGMNIIHDLGLTLSPSSLLNKRKDMVKQQGRSLCPAGLCCVEDADGEVWTVTENPPHEQMDTTESSRQVDGHY